MSVLHVDSISKSYHGKVILSDVFLACKLGEVKGLLGRNGSGKSTLLKIIFGIEKSDFKFIKIGDRHIKNLSEGRGLINYLPQENFLPNSIRIKSLIALFLEKENRDVVLKNPHIVPLLDKKNQELSGGEKRIVEILLIIHSKADFILLDEPFNGVSPIVRDYIIDYLKSMKAKKGFIITDHDYKNVIHLADTLVCLQNGVLKAIASHDDLLDLGYLTEASLKALKSI